MEHRNCSWETLTMSMAVFNSYVSHCQRVLVAKGNVTVRHNTTNSDQLPHPVNFDLRTPCFLDDLGLPSGVIKHGWKTWTIEISDTSIEFGDFPASHVYTRGYIQ